jgi:hypothetical protein
VLLLPTRAASSGTARGVLSPSPVASDPGPLTPVALIPPTPVTLSAAPSPYTPYSRHPIPYTRQLKPVILYRPPYSAVHLTPQIRNPKRWILTPWALQSISLNLPCTLKPSFKAPLLLRRCAPPPPAPSPHLPPWPPLSTLTLLLALAQHLLLHRRQSPPLPLCHFSGSPATSRSTTDASTTKTCSAAHRQSLRDHAFVSLSQQQCVLMLCVTVCSRMSRYACVLTRYAHAVCHRMLAYVPTCVSVDTVCSCCVSPYARVCPDMCVC